MLVDAIVRCRTSPRNSKPISTELLNLHSIRHRGAVRGSRDGEGVACRGGEVRGIDTLGTLQTCAFVARVIRVHNDVRHLLEREGSTTVTLPVIRFPV